MVDDFIRTQAEKLQEASELTRVRLKEMDFPDSVLALEGNFTLPTDLKEDGRHSSVRSSNFLFSIRFFFFFF